MSFTTEGGPAVSKHGRQTYQNSTIKYKHISRNGTRNKL